MGAAREHGILDALPAAGVRVNVDGDACRKIRCCPHWATDLIKAVLVLIHAGGHQVEKAQCERCVRVAAASPGGSGQGTRSSVRIEPRTAD
jgi:hypothetical protein